MSKVSQCIYFAVIQRTIYQYHKISLEASDNLAYSAYVISALPSELLLETAIRVKMNIMLHVHLF